MIMERKKSVLIATKFCEHLKEIVFNQKDRIICNKISVLRRKSDTQRNPLLLIQKNENEKINVNLYF